MSAHPLDRALDSVVPRSDCGDPRLRRFVDLGKLALWVGNAAFQPCKSMLDAIIDITAGWLISLGVEDPAEAMRHEYDLACIKHPGMTLDGDAPTDKQRAAALVEELGEVARALTYDRDHAGELTTELAQLGGLAAAWLIHEMRSAS